VGTRVLRGHRGRTDHHLRPVRPQHVLLVLTDLVRADEHALVALELRHHGQADPGVAAGWFDDRAPGSELAGAFGFLHHPQRDPVLYRTTWIDVLHLREHQSVNALGHPVEPHQRRIADQFDHVVVVAHPRSLAAPSAPGETVDWPPPAAR